MPLAGGSENTKIEGCCVRKAFCPKSSFAKVLNLIKNEFVLSKKEGFLSILIYTKRDIDNPMFSLINLGL